MIICEADKSGEVITVSYSQRVSVEDMRRYSEKVRELLPRIKPGFLLFSDLTSLESMDPDCAPELGALMELFCESGMATVVRVIPDPYKEIGINLISRFHLQSQVKVQTHESLAEAIKSLLCERPEVFAQPMVGTTTDASST